MHIGEQNVRNTQASSMTGWLCVAPSTICINHAVLSVGAGLRTLSMMVQLARDSTRPLDTALSRNPL